MTDCCCGAWAFEPNEDLHASNCPRSGIGLPTRKAETSEEKQARMAKYDATHGGGSE